MKHIRTPALAWALLALAVTAFAQSTTTVNGRVVDQLGAPIANATVTLTGSVAAALHTARTAADGSFQVPAVPSGGYRLQVESPGFYRWSGNVAVGAGSPPLEVTLHVSYRFSS
jgi:hypothetical protein